MNTNGSIDRAKVRIPIDPSGAPQLTALGAGVDIPGALKGKGYLEIKDNGVTGGLDLTITPVKLRVAAQFRLEHINPPDGPATAFIVNIEVEFPTAIPLAGC